MTEQKKDSENGTPKGKPAQKKISAKEIPKSKKATDSNENSGSVPYEMIKTFPIVAIGSSAGGLEAMEEFFKNMLPKSGIAVVIITHLSPNHTSILPELLQKHTSMKVCQTKNNTLIEQNSVYVIPPGKDLAILNGTLQLMETTSHRGAHLPIDSFFRSLALDQGANAIAIILSGRGTDGTLGLKDIKGGLGMIMAQSEDSAKYSGMP